MKVLVTGANGHLGFNLCKALLARPGYEVRASVKSLADAAKVAPLRALGGIELAELDVRDAAQFGAALKGVDTLFHVAATYAIVTKGAGAVDAMMRDSVEGVEVALAAAAGVGVRRVVLTSSVVTLLLRRPGEPPATEADWTSDLRVPYYRAKVEAEQAAWRIAGKLNLALVSVLPGGIGGPGFQRRTPTLDLLEGIMLGSQRFATPESVATVDGCVYSVGSARAASWAGRRSTRCARASRTPCRQSARCAARRASGAWPESQAVPHTSRATPTISSSLRHWSPCERALPWCVLEKPHCGDRHRSSSGTNFAASAMRRLSIAASSISPTLVVTRPSTTYCLWAACAAARRCRRAPSRTP